MNFYHNLVTKKSWQLLQSLKRQYQFILIGGWAVFLHTGALKSKDIDLVMEYEELEKLKEDFEVTKNERLKKYEAREKEVEIDIYVPFYSNIGLPAEDLKKFSHILEGFEVVEKEVLAILKQKALIARKDTVKGKKDLADLASLFQLDDFNWQKYRKVIIEYHLEEGSKITRELLKKTRKIEELDLNLHQMARLKKKILILV